jgi:hypothetical protein
MSENKDAKGAITEANQALVDVQQDQLVDSLRGKTPNAIAKSDAAKQDVTEANQTLVTLQQGPLLEALISIKSDVNSLKSLMNGSIESLTTRLAAVERKMEIENFTTRLMSIEMKIASLIPP